MTVRVLRHPYEPGTRVCHAKETKAALRTDGAAEVVDSRPRADGSYEYLVRTDAGNTESWPSYFTIPVAGAPRARHGERAAAGPATTRP